METTRGEVFVFFNSVFMKNSTGQKKREKKKRKKERKKAKKLI